LQRVLELPARDPPADSDVLRRLQEKIDALHLGKLRPQPGDHFERSSLAILARLEPDEETAGIERIAGAAAKERSKTLHVGIAHDHLGKLSLEPHHFLRRDILRGLRNSLDQAGVLEREEAFRNENEHDARDGDRGHKHDQRGKLMTQHDVEHAPIAAYQRLKTPFNTPIDATMPLGLFDDKARA